MEVAVEVVAAVEVAAFDYVGSSWLREGNDGFNEESCGGKPCCKRCQTVDLRNDVMRDSSGEATTPYIFLFNLFKSTQQLV